LRLRAVAPRAHPLGGTKAPAGSHIEDTGAGTDIGGLERAPAHTEPAHAPEAPSGTSEATLRVGESCRGAC